MPTTDYQPPTQLIRYSGLDKMTDHSTQLEGYIARSHKPVNANKHVVYFFCNSVEPSFTIKCSEINSLCTYMMSSYFS